MNPATASKLQGLAEPLRSAIAELLERTGEAVWIVSGRRSNTEQIQLRRAHCGTSWYDIYEKPSSECSPPTARPGHSKHESGLAVDLGGDLALAAKVGSKLGLSRPVRGENWHFEGGNDDLATAQLLTSNGDLQAIGNPLGGIEGAVGDALGKLVEPFVGGLRRIALTGLLVAGGVGLVLMGGIRGVRSQGGT